jgi:hypothetical protein
MSEMAVDFVAKVDCNGAVGPFVDSRLDAFYATSTLRDAPNLGGWRVPRPALREVAGSER